MFYKRLFIHLNLVFHLIFLYMWVSEPKQLFWPALVFVINFLVRLFVFFTEKKSQKINTILSPDIWLILSEILVLLFIEFDYMKYVIIFSTALIVFLYQRNLFFSFAAPFKFKSNLFSFLKDFNIYVASLYWLIAIFAFKIFMNLDFWLSFLIVLTISYLAIFFLLKNSNQKITENKILIFIYCLTSLELFIIVSWLPFNFYIKALSMVSYYHIFSGLAKLFLKKKIDPKAVWRYVVIFVIIWLGVLVTARWY
jgi:hypothetical protein